MDAPAGTCSEVNVSGSDLLSRSPSDAAITPTEMPLHQVQALAGLGKRTGAGRRERSTVFVIRTVKKVRWSVFSVTSSEKLEQSHYYLLLQLNQGTCLYSVAPGSCFKSNQKPFLASIISIQHSQVFQVYFLANAH